MPHRAEGVELIGELESSGFEDPPSLVRRSDGQVVQLTELLYLTLEAVDGSRDLQAIAEVVSAKLGRSATADNIRFLLDEKLRPLGLLRLPDGSDPSPRKANPLLALRWKFVLSNERLTNRITAPFSHLFHRPVVVAVLLAFAGVTAWVLAVRGLAQGVREALYSPGLLLLVFGLTVVSAGFHEFGHAAACRYGGARPGVMGAGIYLVWPAFYTDVTDAYRLGRAGRLRTDLGGLYFNAVFVLAAVSVWALTGWEALLLVVPLQLMQMLHQLLPVVRMDGYYILSDLTGVPDLFARIKPTLASALPGHDTAEQAAPLKRWVRRVVTGWVVIVVPLLLAAMTMAVIALPRVLATAWDSLLMQADAMGVAADRGQWMEWVVRALSIGALVLPIAGTLYMLARIARRLTERAWAVTRHHPRARWAGVGAVAASLIALAVLWWPNGEYRPIQPGERGTVLDGAHNVSSIGTGRPGLSPQRERELGGAPGRRGTVDEPAATVPATTPQPTSPQPTSPATNPSPATSSPPTSVAGSVAPASTELVTTPTSPAVVGGATVTAAPSPTVVQPTTGTATTPAPATDSPSSSTTTTPATTTTSTSTPPTTEVNP